MSETGHPRGLVAAFVLAVAIAVLLGGHALWRIGWMERAAVAPVEGWMTPRYVVHAYGVPRGDLAPILGLREEDTPFRTLNDLAADMGVEPGALIADVEAAVQAARGAAP